MFSSKGKRDMRTVWGYTFEWTPEHLTKEQMRPMTYSYDTLASDVLDRLDQLSPPSNKPPPTSEKETQQEGSEKDEVQDEVTQDEKEDEQTKDDKSQADTASDEKDAASQDAPSQPKPARRDLYALVLEHHESDPVIAEFYNQLHDIPSWVDWDQIARGQAVFYRYGGPAIVALTFQSLVGGMASTRVTQTLTRTGGFHAATAKHRLLETFQHILQVTASPAALQPAGAGFAASVRVRLLHAHVRRRILSLSQQDPRYFDVAEWGVPINDLDCLGTVLSFSAALLWVGLPRQGIWATDRERDDYTALWRWVGHLLGTPPATATTAATVVGPGKDWLATPRSAKVLFESLALAELAAPRADEGGVLANNILTALSAQPPAYASRAFMCAEARWLNGGPLCDALGIARGGVWYGGLVAAQCVYFMGVCYVRRLVPAWDARNRERVRKILYKLTVENKEIGLGQETIFDFKHVPQSSLLKTPLGDMSGGRQIGRSERRGLVTLAVVSVLVGSVAWFGLRGLWRAGGVGGVFG